MSAIGRARDWVQSVHPLVTDGLLALVLAVALLADLRQQELPTGGPWRPADPLGVVLVALLVLPLAFRRRFPVGTWGVILAAAVTVVALLYRPSSFGFGLLVATYTVARWCERRISLPVVGLSLLFGVLAKGRAVAAGVTIGWFDWPLDVVYFGAAWFLGDSIRARNRYAEELEESRAALADHAVAEERVRIARELHDTVGHSVSVMVLHAGGGDEMVDRDPERAHRAFHAVAQVGRATLNEMDRMVGLLRTQDGSATQPPTLQHIGRLVDTYRELGLDIDVSMASDVGVLPPAVDQSAYRIIEEALANAITHAGPTRVDLSLADDEHALLLAIRDHGAATSRRRPRRSPHSGRGLVGMRERAALVEGHVTAAPHPEGGFVVTATLPRSGGPT